MSREGFSGAEASGHKVSTRLSSAPFSERFWLEGQGLLQSCRVAPGVTQNGYSFNMFFHTLFVICEYRKGRTQRLEPRPSIVLPSSHWPSHRRHPHSRALSCRFALNLLCDKSSETWGGMARGHQGTWRDLSTKCMVWLFLSFFCSVLVTELRQRSPAESICTSTETVLRDETVQCSKWMEKHVRETLGRRLRFRREAHGRQGHGNARRAVQGKYDFPEASATSGSQGGEACPVRFRPHLGPRLRRDGHAACAAQRSATDRAKNCREKSAYHHCLYFDLMLVDAGTDTGRRRATSAVLMWQFA